MNIHSIEDLKPAFSPEIFETSVLKPELGNLSVLLNIQLGKTI